MLFLDLFPVIVALVNDICDNYFLEKVLQSDSVMGIMAWKTSKSTSGSRGLTGKAWENEH